MLNLISRCKSLMNEEEGQTMVEYALILVFIALGVAVTFPQVAAAITARLTEIVGELS